MAPTRPVTKANSFLASSYRSLANNSTGTVKSVGAKTVKLSD